MDWYLLVSLVFVFGTLVEVAFVLVTKQTLHILLKRSSMVGAETGNNFCIPIHAPEIATLSHKNSSVQSSCQHNKFCILGVPLDLSDDGREKDENEITRRTIMQTISKELSVINKLDILAFLVFNVTYMTFNVIYFCTL